MIWQPINLTELCPTYPSTTACSSFGYMYLNLLIQLYSGSVDQKKKERCRGNVNTKSNNGRKYDFIVVGAGPAGCVVANRLTENPKWKVLLLEAGPEEPDVTSVPALLPVALGSNIDWRYSTEPDGKTCLAYPGGRCSLPRGKTMGGSSSINALSYIRGNREDYDGWARLGNKGWSYDEVLPFFRKSERNLNIESLDSRYHGVRGEQYVSKYPYMDQPSAMLTKAYVQAGLPLTDFNSPEQIGVNQVQATSVEGERASANVAFIRPIRFQRLNLHVVTDAEARKILIDKHKNAYGIVYFKNNKKYIAYAGKEVIISCGSINSPKLLMLSGIGPQKHLKRLNISVVKDLPVGKNLQDHVAFYGVLVALPNKSGTSVSNKEVLYAINDYANMELKRGPLAAAGPLNSFAFIKTEHDSIAPDLQFVIFPVSDLEKYIQDPIKARISGLAPILPLAYYNGLIIVPTNLVPYSIGKLWLNSTHPNASPLIFPNYLGDERDFKPMLKGVRFLHKLQYTEAFQSCGAYFVQERLPPCEHYEWGTDEYYFCLAKAYTSSAFHLVGTCKMGPKNDKTAVLDNELRVRGIGSLRVIDASIMPVIVHGNTNAPTLMIGERGADFIIKYWRARTNDYC